MAPFNTHFLVAEQLWPDVMTGTEWPQNSQRIYYGQFCFGCIAPDVDKLSITLTQKDTHFFDRTGPWGMMASHRSVEFIRCRDSFFYAPFSQLQPDEKAFALGYLCHLCVDEVSKHMWQHETWLHFKEIGPGPAFAALDEAARQRIRNHPAIANALTSLSLLDVVPCIPPPDLAALLAGTRRFVTASTLADEFLALVDMFDTPTPAEREQKLELLQQGLDFARQNIHYFRLAQMVSAAIRHSRLRLVDLLAGRLPEPGYPDL